MKTVSVSSLRLASLPLPPRASPVRRRKPVGRAAAVRPLFVDQETAEKVAREAGRLPPVSTMPFECPVLVVGKGVSAFRAEHVAAALRQRGLGGYWLIELEPRRAAATGNGNATQLVGFSGLHVARISGPRARH